MKKGLIFVTIMALGSLQTAQSMQMPVDPVSAEVVKAFSHACQDPAVCAAYAQSMENSQDLMLAWAKAASDQMSLEGKELTAALLRGFVEMMDVMVGQLDRGAKAVLDPADQMRMMQQAQLLLQLAMPIANAAAVSLQEEVPMANVSGLLKGSMSVYRAMIDCFARS